VKDWIEAPRKSSKMWGPPLEGTFSWKVGLLKLGTTVGVQRRMKTGGRRGKIFDAKREKRKGTKLIGKGGKLSRTTKQTLPVIAGKTKVWWNGEE